MKYLCTVYLEPNALQGLSADELAKLNRDSLDYNDELAKKGHYIAASALQPPQTDCFGGGDRVGRISLPSGYGIEDYDLEFFLGKGRAIKSLIYIFCLILLSGMQPYNDLVGIPSIQFLVIRTALCEELYRRPSKH
jgi:hypothetical protein